ncbi:MAG TPA: segregation/condensation protein A [Fimbriimonadaceae bacterium]|nr:segregation/condensation protein A [Fimbriimonadaceae bacterium]
MGVVAPPPIEVQTPTFDGSLGMLFQCVRDRKVDLMDVPLAPICEAYFLYLMNSPSVGLDEAAAALAALAFLLERKAWGLLPVAEPEPEIEEPLELPAPSVGQYNLAIEALNVWQEERSKTFFRSFEGGPDPYEVPYKLSDVTPTDLARAFERLLRRASPDVLQNLAAPRRSLAEQMSLVLKSLARKWLSLDLLVPPEISRSEAVYWFLALLELMRLGQAKARMREDEVEFALAS